MISQEWCHILALREQKRSSTIARPAWDTLKDTVSKKQKFLEIKPVWPTGTEIANFIVSRCSISKPVLLFGYPTFPLSSQHLVLSTPESYSILDDLDVPQYLPFLDHQGCSSFTLTVFTVPHSLAPIFIHTASGLVIPTTFIKDGKSVSIACPYCLKYI